MSAIFTNITHELLTPLTVISASVDKLRDEEPKFRHDYDLMQLNIQRMVRLLQQILETSKSEAGGLKLRVAHGDVMKYIHETARCLEPLISQKKMKFTVQCHPESMMGWIDTDKLDKIIYNLLSNAAKYANENGEVAIKAFTNKTYDHIRIEVSDTGSGISKEKMKHLFQRFQDGDYRQHKTIGTGLGLALTHDLVYLHGGTIRCESEENKGTTFIVTLPISKETFTSDLILGRQLLSTAKQMHEIYREGSGGSAPAWEELPAFLKQSNLAAASHLQTKVRILLGEEDLTALTAGKCREAFEVYRETREEKADLYRWIEHERWLRFYGMNNWTYDPVRNDRAHRHPLMVPFEELSPEEQKKDDYAWELLEAIGRRAE